MRFVDAPDVCAARSSFSHSRTRAPRPARSRAMPAPLMPPPTTSTSTSRRAAVGIVSAAVVGIATILASPPVRADEETTTMPSATPHLLALDQGTSSSRAIVFDPRGRIVALAQREFRQIYPQPGWVEHDPREIWSSQLATAREALASARLEAADIAGIGITNQRETTIVWNRATGEPIANAIVWQDRRTAAACEKLKKAGHAKKIARKTGLVIDAYLSGTKLQCLLENTPSANAKAKAGQPAIGTIRSWLIW